MDMTVPPSFSSIFNSCPSDPTTVFISASVAQIDAQRRAFEQRLHQACTDYVRTLFDFTLGSELAAADYPEGCHRKMQLYMDKGTAAIKAALDEVAIYLLMLDRRNLPPEMLQQQQLLEEKENFFNDNNSVGCNGSVLQQQQSHSVSSFIQPPQPAFSASNGHSSEFFSTPSQHSFTSFPSPSSITVSPESTVSTATAAAVLTPTKDLLGELQFRMTMQSLESKHQINGNSDGIGFKNHDSPRLPPPPSPPSSSKRSVQPLSLAGDGSGSGSVSGACGGRGADGADDLMANGSCSKHLFAKSFVSSPPSSSPPLSHHHHHHHHHQSALYSCPLSIGCRPIVSRTKLRKHLLHDHAINNCDVAGLLRKAVRLGGSNGVVNGSGGGGGGGSGGNGGANGSNLMMIKSAKCAAGARAFSRGLTPCNKTFFLAPKLSPEQCDFASLPPISFDTDLRR